MSTKSPRPKSFHPLTAFGTVLSKTMAIPWENFPSNKHCCIWLFFSQSWRWKNASSVFGEVSKINVKGDSQGLPIIEPPSGKLPILFPYLYNFLLDWYENSTRGSHVLRGIWKSHWKRDQVSPPGNLPMEYQTVDGSDIRRSAVDVVHPTNWSRFLLHARWRRISSINSSNGTIFF